jgi:hypothetical protein
MGQQSQKMRYRGCGTNVESENIQAIPNVLISSRLLRQFLALLHENRAVSTLMLSSLPHRPDHGTTCEFLGGYLALEEGVSVLALQA